MRHRTEGWQDHDIDLRVPEEPEHMLEQHRVATTRSVKETGAEVDVHQHHGDHAGQNWHDSNQQERSDQPGPDEQGHLHQSHARRPHVQDGSDHVDSTHDRRHAHDVNGEDKERGTGRAVGRRQRRVEGPAEVGRTALHEQCGYQNQEGARQEPEAPVVHSWQRHIRCAHHQRNHPVGKANEGRHNRAEHHDQTMHSGHLVEKFRLNNLQARLEQFSPDYHGHGSAEQEHRETEYQVHGPDIFVVGRQQPPRKALCGAVVVIVLGVGICNRTHEKPPLPPYIQAGDVINLASLDRVG